MQTGDLVFGDRDAVWKSIPDGLLGAESIVTACDAKNSTGDTIAEFTAGADMNVWIALDQRVENVPAWMEGYQTSALAMENSKDVTFKLYSREVKLGETVTLGTNGQSASCVNYVVLATEGDAKIRGDVNSDGSFGVADVVMLQKWLLCAGDITDWTAGDLCEDGTLNVFDLCIMKRELLQK